MQRQHRSQIPTNRGRDGTKVKQIITYIIIRVNTLSKSMGLYQLVCKMFYAILYSSTIAAHYFLCSAYSGFVERQQDNITCQREAV